MLSASGCLKISHASLRPQILLQKRTIKGFVAWGDWLPVLSLLSRYDQKLSIQLFQLVMAFQEEQTQWKLSSAQITRLTVPEHVKIFAAVSFTSFVQIPHWNARLP